MTNEEVVEEALEFAEEYRVDAAAPKALALLRDAGFVRGATLHQAYREGYERGVYVAGGGAEILPEVDAPGYVRLRDQDLAQIGRA